MVASISLSAPHSWLHGLIDTYAEPNPDKPEVHLPMGMKSDVHGMYMDEVRCGNEELHPVSMKYFNYVWRVRVPHLKVRVFHRFPFAFMCVVCQYLSNLLLCTLVLILTGLQCVSAAPR